MRHEVQLLGEDMVLTATAQMEYKGEIYEVPLKVGRTEHGKAVLIPDFQEVMYKVRALKARGIVK